MPTLSDVVVGDANRAAHEACRTICHQQGSPRRVLVLEGPSGSGKSFLLAAIAGELRHLGSGPVLRFRGAELTDDAVASSASAMHWQPPAALLIDEVDALPTLPRLVSPLGTLVGDLCVRGTRVVMACRRWTPELDILLAQRATSVRCRPLDLDTRRAIVARMSDATGAEAEAEAVDLLARASLPHAGHLVALAGRTLARARLSGLPVTATSVASALRRSGRRRPDGAATVRATPVRPVRPVAEHLGGPPASVPELGAFPTDATDVLDGFGALGRALCAVGPNQRMALEEQPDRDRGQLARRAAIHAALAGRSVLLHTPHTDAEVVAQSLVALLSGVPDPWDTNHPGSVRRAAVRAEVKLGSSSLYLSDDPAVPIAHAGGIATEVRRRYGRPVDLVVTEGAALDRPLDACPVDRGAGLIASTRPSGLVAAERCGERAWAFAHHEGRRWARRMPDDWSEVDGPAAPRQGPRLLPLVRDETGAALGWRLWSVRYGAGGAASVVSPVKATLWQRGVLTSSCTSCGECPTAACTCGIYAHGCPEDVILSWRKHTELVAGKVRAWGTVIRHTDGFRAQHAQIDTLYVSSSIAPVGDALGRRYDCSIEPW